MLLRRARILHVARSARPARDPMVKIVSWNLLRLTGASLDDVVRLARREQPDLLLMQEATQRIDELPSRIGGTYARVLLPGRIHGLAMWSPTPLPPPVVVELPAGAMFERVCQVVDVGTFSVANVHLSHGQLLNRRQLRWIAAMLPPRAAVLPDGIVEYRVSPPVGRQGVADAVFGTAPPGVAPAPRWPADPVVPLGVHGLNGQTRLELIANATPGLTPGLLARPVPVALAEGPLAVSQMPGVALTIPVQVAPGGALAVAEPLAPPRALNVREQAAVIAWAGRARWCWPGASRPIPAPPSPRRPPGRRMRCCRRTALVSWT